MPQNQIAMIVEHQTLDLFGKMVFEKAIIKTPFQKSNPMPDEACFLYVLRGENHSISEVEEIRAVENEALLIKCGRFLSRMLSSEDHDIYEAIAVHFYPEVSIKAPVNEIQSHRSTGNSLLFRFDKDGLF